MATLETSARNAACDAVVDLIDAATSAGYMQIETSGDAEVSTHTFSDPAFGAAASGTATANSIGDDTSATGGTAAQFSWYDGDDNKILEGTATVTGGGGDLELSSLTIGAGVTVSITSFTATQPAS